MSLASICTKLLQKFHKIPQNNLLFQSKSGLYEEITNNVIFGLIYSRNETKKITTNNENKNTTQRKTQISQIF